ncbi:lysophospholipid acyltransferase family protein [Nocardioides jiangxiensis]|uniref:Lysophospholipid acyltransferase family protein n=1 Tax=Nocardioides jiangxiensis TaxID=3064524 RepID=A0ABT9B2V7_9ACTN|nr:lysophospholipid acyltransferase family protein [Nocardioides sp. WY-20]MDO7869154.1 lysophospholipid acyltransferase family protein [Nocardioides sp. WY-20]
MTGRKWPRKPGAGFQVGRVILLPTLTAMSGREWIDGEKIPASGGVVLVANHVTKIDPLTIAHFVHHHGRLPRFLAKAGLWDVPGLGSIMRSAKQIPVARMSGDARNAFDAAERALLDGECLVVYPEGTVTRDPDLWPMRGKTGAARMALATGVPVIPVGHWGEQEILPPYATRPHLFPRKRVVVKAGDPVDLADLMEGEVTAAKVAEATDRIMAALTAVVEDLRGETAPAVRFDPKAQGVAEIGNPKKQKRKKGQA